MLLKKARTWITCQNLRSMYLDCAISALLVAFKISSKIKRQKILDTEIWLCFSSVSYILAYCYINELLNKKDNKTSNCKSFLVLSRAICPDKVQLFIQESRNTSIISLFPESLTSNLLLFSQIFLKIFQGNSIKLRMPHLYEPIVGQSILRLAKLNFISLEFYDDGLLGCLSNPTVTSFYPKTISNICHWDTACWNAPSNINVLSQSVIPLRQFKLYTQTEKQRAIHCKSNVIVVEAKYMDYSLLNQIFASPKRFDPLTKITYFLHPSLHKRNSGWPSKTARKVVQNIQCETWLLLNLSAQSHVYSAVTSSVLLACEFALQKMIPSFKLSLLIEPQKSPDGLEAFYNKSEAQDFTNCIVAEYASVMDIEIINCDHICC